MASQFSKADMGAGLSLVELPKSNVFTSKLPPDPAFDTPEASHKAQRERLYPRTVKGAAFTFVRPETTEDPELLGVSPRAMKDLGLKPGEENTAQFKAVVAGNEFYWDEENGGVYPWAQCYGGWQLYVILIAPQRKQHIDRRQRCMGWPTRRRSRDQPL
jgi:hypothetical protein